VRKKEAMRKPRGLFELDEYASGEEGMTRRRNALGGRTSNTVVATEYRKDAMRIRIFAISSSADT